MRGASGPGGILRRSRAEWRLWRLALAAAAFVTGFGCSYDPHFESGVTLCAPPDVSKRCPDGFMCDVPSGKCVTVGGGDGGSGAGTGGSGSGGTSGGGSGGMSGGGSGGTSGGGSGGTSGGGMGGKATGGVSGGGSGGAGAGGISGTGGKVGTGGGMGAGGTPGTGGMSGGGAGGMNVGGAGGSVTGTIVTYKVPTANAHPFQLTVGPDNNIWFTEAAGSKIGRCTTGGTITEFATTTPAAGAWDIVSLGGFLWFSETNLNKIGKCDTTGAMLAEFPIMVGTMSTSLFLATGPDGNIWYTDVTNSRVGRMTPTGTSVAFAATASSQPMRIAAGPDGNLWFTEFIGNHVSKITTAGIITRYQIPTSSGFPVAIASDLTSGLAFLEISKIGRIVAATGQITVEYPLPTGVANSEGGNVVLATDGNFWFSNGADSIMRLTPTGTITRYVVPGTNQMVSGLTQGPDGNLWFADLLQGNIGRISP